MPRFTRRSGLSLVLVGLIGAIFFWITDPRYGLALHWNHADNPIDLANWQFPGTVVGVGGSLVVLSAGLYLLTRKSL
jgi:hypothetical protein